MMLKKGIETFFVIVFITGAVLSRQIPPSSPPQRQERLAAGVVPPTVIKKDGSNFDQQRLIALFGSETQPVYGNRDPTTGQVILVAAPSISGSAGAAPADRSTPLMDDQDTLDSMESSPASDSVDRKDTRVPETNEINPFELLPPQFHDLLNIPIHDYGNGTTYNPYDKFKIPAKSKYPLVSTGYANTKYQGPPSSSTAKPSNKPSSSKVSGVGQPSSYDDNFAPANQNNERSTRKPAVPVRTTTQNNQRDPSYDPSYNNQQTTKKRVRPTEHEREPETVAVYRPNKPQIETTRYKAATRPTSFDKPEDSVGSTYRPEYRPDSRPDYYRPISSPDTKPIEYKPTSRPLYLSEDEKPLEDEFDDWPYPSEEKKPSKPAIRPSSDDDFNPYHRPSQDQPSNRPTYSVVADSIGDRSPLFTNQPSYRPSILDDDQIAEIKVTPKPFYAADDNQNFNAQEERLHGQVDDEPDIIYDYDDERSKGEGVMFMFDNGPSDAIGPNGPSIQAKRPVTQSPLASPYPTVASREPKPQQNFNPAFRPSPLVRPTGEVPFLSSPPSMLQNDHKRNSISPQQKPSYGTETSRPHFRFPSEQPTVGEANPVNLAPNILPLFRPNTNPTDEFQFIKHPQQVDFQRQPSYQTSLPGPLNRRPLSPPPGPDGPSRQQIQRPSSGISPLPSALQSPFSSISQKVANFFGRRSGPFSGNHRSSDLMPSTSVKMDRTGLVDPTEVDGDLDMAESSGSLVLFSRPDQPLSSVSDVDRSGLSLQHPTGQQAPGPGATGAHPQVVGIRAAPDTAGNKPPAFYVYTSRELEKGQPPYLVVGPVLSGPPSVSGARLVHTAPAKPIQSPDSQRRSDSLSDDPSVTNPQNSLPLFSPPLAPKQEILAARQSENSSPTRKPFFPISNNNKADRLPTGLSPPRLQIPINNRRPPPGFFFPETPSEPDTSSILPQGISPVSQGIPPPRVPLNPQKDIASLFSNPTLLHNRPNEFQVGSTPQRVTDQSLPTSNADIGVATVLNVPLNDEPSTPRPLKRKTTKAPARTTTPIYMEAFNNPQPATYDTIQQEDGKQIAVVHPAYIVTFKSKPGPPELIDLDAPFIPSIETPLEEEGFSKIEFEKWHAMPQEIKRKDENLEPSRLSSSNTAESLEYHGGFQPVVPEQK